MNVLIAFSRLKKKDTKATDGLRFLENVFGMRALRHEENAEANFLDITEA